MFIHDILTDICTISTVLRSTVISTRQQLPQGGGFAPEEPYQVLALLAVLASCVNIGGGFMITRRMLDMFRRPTDPPGYEGLYVIPGAVLMGGYLVALSTLPESGYAGGLTEAGTSADRESEKNYVLIKYKTFLYAEDSLLFWSLCVILNDP